MILWLKAPALALLLAAPVLPLRAAAQTAALHGEVQDPSGAVVPGADLSLTGGGQTLRAKSSADGQYAFHALAPGSYALAVTAKGFAPLMVSDISLVAGEAKQFNPRLSIAVAQQEITITGHNQGVSMNPENNASATVLKGSAIDALSDDPTELENELQALAGPAAGPNGGQIYIDGFEGGQIPPKADILEIRVNQNPFSAEFDRMGYGRIEIITKPGTKKLTGSIGGWGTNSALGTANPFLAGKPSYGQYSYWGNISGPISKTASYFFSANNLSRQDETIVDALDPATLANFSESYPTPLHYFNLTPTIDFQISKNNFMSIHDRYARIRSQGVSVGVLVLPEQAANGFNWSNDVQIADTWVLNSKLLMEPRFLWRRIGNNTMSLSTTPTVAAQGAFTTGGNGIGTLHDHQDVFMLQDYFTATAGPHTLRFGGRARAWRDTDFSTAGMNGSYLFNCSLASQCSASYQSATPAQYSATVIENPVARALLFDGALFLQDDWHINHSFLLGLGMRYEGQNYIHDHADWAPRIDLAWALGHPGKNQQQKTVIRAGYGWFFNRFIMNTAFSSGSEPYIITAIHDNRINQQSYVVKNPNSVFPAPDQFDPNQPATIPASTLSSAAISVPAYHTVDPHFHAALDMQGGIGVDRQIAKHITGNVTYLYTQGVHQYMTNNATAPTFDLSDYTITGPTPPVYNYQFQSEGFYRQSQLIFTVAVQLKKLTVSGNYVLNEAKSDTQGINSFPSVAQNPGLDYGRATFGIRHRVSLLQSYTAPHGVVIAVLVAAQSGTPYNITIGRDLTGNNQFNARPTYGTCGDPGVVTTQYGCLDTDPAGKSEPMIPYGVGLGPSNAIVHLRISKAVGIGPRIKTETGGQTYTPGDGNVNNRGIGGGSPVIRVDAAAPRRYNLTFIAGALNAFNMVNLGTPNGVLLSPLFNQTQSVAGGQFGSPTPGTRSFYFQTNFSF